MNYRKDIDGLRAIAVLLVIFGHMYPKYITGGFVGVDIFFVISGFLITNIIYSQIELGTFSLLSFYNRRMSRILPNLIFMVLCVSLFVWFFFPAAGQISDFFKSTIYNLGYFSNWYFAKNIGANYFAASSAELPLLHTWSLSVEEQFYFVWPFVLILVSRYQVNKIHKIILLLIFLSLISAVIIPIYFTQLRTIGYYMPYSRAYELLSGGLLAVMLKSRKLPVLQKLWLLCFNYLSIILIILVTFLYNDKLVYPSYWGLIPVAAALLLLYSGYYLQNGFIYKLISSQIMVSIGLLSYSLYLWHWPILALYRFFNVGTVIGLIDGLSLMFIIVVFSVVSYFIIEKPARKNTNKFSTNFILLVALPLSISIGFFSLVKYTAQYPARLSLDAQRQSSFTPRPYCADRIVGNCVFGDKNIQTPAKVVMFGDSHASADTPFWDKVAKTLQFNIKITTIGGCLPLLVGSTITELVTERVSCPAQNQQIQRDIDKYDVFILTFAHYTWQESNPFWNEIESTIQLLSKLNKKIIITGDVPIARDGDKFTNYSRRSTLPSILQNNNITADDINGNFSSEKMIVRLLKKYPNLYYLDLQKDVIAKIKTYPFVNGTLAYIDENHINGYASEQFADIYIQTPGFIQLSDKLKEWKVLK